MMLDPFALGGPHFLLLYALMLVVTGLIGHWAAERLRPDGRPHSLDDADSLALLSGGPQRLAEAAVTRLMAAGQLRHDSRDRFVRGPAAAPARGELDRVLLGLPMPVRWRELAQATTRESRRLYRQLQGRGLVLADGERMQLRLVRAVPVVALLVLGVLRLAQGLAHHKPVGLLFLLLFATVWLLLRALAVDPCNRAGIAAVQRARADHRRLRLAAPDAEAGLAVALFGTSVLAGSWLESLHRLRVGSGEGGVDASSDGDGGGCGGCGS